MTTSSSRRSLTERVFAWLNGDVLARRADFASVQVCQGGTELTRCDVVDGDVPGLSERVAQVLRTYSIPDARAGTSFALYALASDGKRFAGPWPVKVTGKDCEESPENAVLQARTGDPTVEGWVRFSAYQSQQLLAKDETIAERDELTRKLIESVVGCVSQVQVSCAAIAAQATALTEPLNRALASEREARIAAEQASSKLAEMLERAIETCGTLAKERDEAKETRAFVASIAAQVLGVDVKPNGAHREGS